MRTSKAGIDLIKRFEGLRTTAYRDAVGVWTIGYGHTAAAGEPTPRQGMMISEAEAETILRRDLRQYEDAVTKACKRTPNRNQFDAFVSLCFNIGPGGFRRSSAVRKFNAGDDAGAADAFLLWNKAGGKVLKGLVRRREAERALFLTPVTDSPAQRDDDKPGPDTTKPATGLWALILAFLRAIFGGAK